MMTEENAARIQSGLNADLEARNSMRYEFDNREDNLTAEKRYNPAVPRFYRTSPSAVSEKAILIQASLKLSFVTFAVRFRLLSRSAKSKNSLGCGNLLIEFNTFRTSNLAKTGGFKSEADPISANRDHLDHDRSVDRNRFSHLATEDQHDEPPCHSLPETARTQTELTESHLG